METPRTSSALDRYSSLFPIGNVGTTDPLRIPGSTIRSASTTIFGSVPTASTRVDHAPMMDGCSLVWHALQCAWNSVSPCFASVSSKPKIAFGHGGGRNLTTFSSRLCKAAKSAELLPYQMVGGIGGTCG